MKILNILSFIILLLMGCHEDLPTPTPRPCIWNCDTSKLEIVWQQPLSKDTTEWGSHIPIALDKGVLFTKSMLDEGPDTLKFLNAKNGNLEWYWSDYLYINKGYSISSNIYERNRSFLFTTGNEVYSVNSLNGGTNWRYEIPTRTGDPYINIINSDVYHGQFDIKSGAIHNSHLVKSNINIDKWDTVYTQPMINNFEPRIGMPTQWVSPQGDNILIFQIRYVDFKTRNLRVDIVAYDIRQKKEYFRFDNIDERGIGSVIRPFVLENKVYVPIFEQVVCINMSAKNIQWQKKFESGGSFTSGQPFIFVENKFFVKSDNRVLRQLDPETGSELWIDKDNGSGCSDMVYHNGLLYYACGGNGKLYAIEVATGKKIWAENSPNKFANKFNGFKARSNANIGDSGVAINAELGYIYVSDFYFAMCLKLPK